MQKEYTNKYSITNDIKSINESNVNDKPNINNNVALQNTKNSKLLLTFAGKTDIGKVRSINQDSFLMDPDLALFIIADGMGGHKGGEIASKLCIEETQKFLKSVSTSISDHTKDGEICNIIQQAVNHASLTIYQKSIENPKIKGMGTTINMVYFVHNKAYFANVGDSRAYIIRSGYIYQITEDHSLVNEQLKAGIISSDEAANYYFKNIVTRTVGYQETEEVDTYVIEIENNDLILLCSDGLYNKINEKEISLICNEKKFDSISYLIDLANQRGGEDNITLILISVKFLE